MPFGQFLATGSERGENGKVERMVHKRLHKLDNFDRDGSGYALTLTEGGEFTAVLGLDPRQRLPVLCGGPK